MTIITLTTDFGLKDGNVGVMKGVIGGIAPAAQLIDLSHLISAQNVAEAALIIHRAVPYFPAGAIHVVVVDPGVGTARRPLAARLGDQYYVGPDNGTLTRWLQRVEQEGASSAFVHLDRRQYWLPVVSHVFHGRDIFAPCAAHLAAGVALEALGTPVSDPLRLELPQPQRTPTGWLAQVIHADHFGNLSTNLYAEHLTGQTVASVRLGGERIDGLVDTFGQRPPGALVALFGSTGNLIVSVVNGSAAQRLDVRPGDAVEVTLAERSTSRA
ncbi:MAG: S-adenosyl-l-methionine hydroxide adenosyltransferase family protein [Chloroflexota bacterium]